MYKYSSAFPFFNLNKLVAMTGVSTGLEYLMKFLEVVGLSAMTLPVKTSFVSCLKARVACPNYSF